jgi:ribose transport system substrate-binding protein
MQSNISSGAPSRAMSRKDRTVKVPRLKQEKTYLVPAVTKVFDILELLGREKTSLSLEQIYQKVKAPKTTIYRLLKTCVHRGYVAQGTDGLYRL